MKKSLSLILFLIFCTQIHAHKPIFNENSSYPPDAPYEIEDPKYQRLYIQRFRVTRISIEFNLRKTLIFIAEFWLLKLMTALLRVNFLLRY